MVIEFQPAVHMKEMDRSAKKNVGAYVSGLISERYFELKKEHFPALGTKR